MCDGSPVRSLSENRDLHHLLCQASPQAMLGYLLSGKRKEKQQKLVVEKDLEFTKARQKSAMPVLTHMVPLEGHPSPPYFHQRK